MNPEFRRNIWLELTTRRLVVMTAALALAFSAAALSGGSDFGPGNVAVALYYFIVVFWGSRNAALSVVGEIRDRTWDLQRLSSIGAGDMTWGKLFGSTIFNWYGGAICLAVILVNSFTHDGLIAAALDLIYFVSLGVIVQAVALLASLVAVRRRQSHSHFEIFLYQLAGLLAAVAVFYIWEAADPAGSIITRKPPTDFIMWWGASLDARGFLLASLAMFTGWTFVGCYREMRRELQLRNGPLVWLAFLALIGIYVAGFDAWLSRDTIMATWNVVALRLALAATAYGALTYAMVLLEPKDRVLYRWIGREIGSGRIGAALWNFQAWMMAYLATFLVSAALIVWLGTGQAAAQAMIASGVGFLTRDCAIFVLFQTLSGKRRGDFGAVVTLIAIYALVPSILHGLDQDAALDLFYVRPTDPVWIAPAIAWGEALVVAALAIGRIALGEKSTRPEPRFS
jgi:hypothetical protein